MGRAAEARKQRKKDGAGQPTESRVKVPAVVFSAQHQELFGLDENGAVQDQEKFESALKGPPARTSKSADFGNTVEDLIVDLAVQKQVLNAKPPRDESGPAQATRRLRRTDLSSSAPALLHDPVQPTNNHVVQSAAYSFGPGLGKPRHLAGKMKIPVLEPRDPEAVGGNSWVPGSGTYEQRHVFGLEVAEQAGGATGGWLQSDHDVFLRVFRAFRYEATEDFFDHLAIILPGKKRLALAQHVRWIAEREEGLRAKRRNADTFSASTRLRRTLSVTNFDTNATATALSLESARFVERAAEERQAKQRGRALHDFAEAEEARWKDSASGGDRRPKVPATQHTVSALGSRMLDGNLRAHPQFHKAPGYTWSASLELRDVREQQFSEMSQVRSSGHLNNPGPGAYLGLEEQDRLLPRRPGYSFSGMKYGDPPLGPSPYERFLALRNAEVEKRLQRVGAKQGELTISILWDTAGGLDLHVVLPMRHDTEIPSSLMKDHKLQPLLPTPARPAPWSSKQAFCLGADEARFEGKAVLLDPARYSSVRQAVSALNAGKAREQDSDQAVSEGDGFAIVRCLGKAGVSFYALYTVGLEDKAYSHFDVPREISFESPWLLGGHMDVSRSTNTGADGRQRIENIHWPALHSGQDPPACGNYKVYAVVDDKSQAGGWLCRVRFGGQTMWCEGWLSQCDASGRIEVCQFKYGGPKDASKKVQEDLGVIQNKQPSVRIGTENGRCGKVSCLLDRSSTDEGVGPGTYAHRSCLLDNQSLRLTSSVGAA